MLNDDNNSGSNCCNPVDEVKQEGTMEGGKDRWVGAKVVLILIFCCSRYLEAPTTAKVCANRSTDTKNSQIIAVCCQILHTWNSTPK